jgi:preprotein translocase subunit SecA
MAKSKVRGGAKAHRKKVASRNEKVNAYQSTMQKLMNESIKTQIEELKKKYESESGDTKTPE